MQKKRNKATEFYFLFCFMAFILPSKTIQFLDMFHDCGRKWFGSPYIARYKIQGHGCCIKTDNKAVDEAKKPLVNHPIFNDPFYPLQWYLVSYYVMDFYQTIIILIFVFNLIAAWDE